MKQLIFLLLVLTSSVLLGQNKLTIKAATQGDGFPLTETVIDSRVNKIKLEAPSIQTFDLQYALLAAGHILVISCEDVPLAAGSNNNYTNNNSIITFKFSKDISNKKISVTDVTTANGSSVELYSFTFTKNVTATAVTAQVVPPAAGNGVLKVGYLQKNANFSLVSTIPSDHYIPMDKDDIGIKVQQIKVKADNLAAGHKLVFDPKTDKDYLSTDAGSEVVLTFSINDISDQLINVKDFDGTNLNPYTSFTLKNALVIKNTSLPALLPPVETAVSLSDYTLTKQGYIANSDESIVHVFFDSYGNNLFGTVPQGIPNVTYIIHIVYPGYTNKKDDITYSVKQKTGNYNPGLVINNPGILTAVGNRLQASPDNPVQPQYDIWKERTFPLSTSTDNIDFDIIATTYDDASKKPANGVLGSYTIKMTTSYHVGLDVGLINSTLVNPTYSLVTSPVDPTKSVVKETNGGNRGIVTVMASFYASPVVLFKKYIQKKNIPDFKVWSRNFLNDHSLFERIYPTVGVSLSSTTFENLFFGVNWEIARGLSIFGGGHWGKVNVFNMPGYQAQVTNVTQAEFDLHTNATWKVNWAYGVKLDVLIITNLFASK